MSSQYGSQKRAAAKQWVQARRKTEKASKRYKSRAPAVGIRNFSRTGALIGAPLRKVLPCKFRVCIAGSLNGGASGVLAASTIKLNSLFDPTGTIGADQPRGFDQLAALYGSYRVKKAKINFKLVNIATAATAMGGDAMCGIQITDGSGTPTNYREAIEHGYCVWDLLPCDQSAKADLSISVDMAKIKAKPVTDGSMSAVVTADPTELVYAHIWLQNTGAIDLNPMDYLVTIDFEAEMFEPITVGAS